jgi:hypothetical protein
MGYSTDFMGSLRVTGPITEEQINYINEFSNTRRVKRNVDKLFELYDGKFGKPGAVDKNDIYGNEGAYFVGADGFMGQQADSSVIDNNIPPGLSTIYDRCKDLTNTQPGLWCQWVLEYNSIGNVDLVWDENEKFYNYVEWLEYLILHFFKPWGLLLDGEITWRGEDFTDIGKIMVENNVVTTKELQM